MRVGATYLDGQRCEFVVWAPRAKKVALKLVTPDAGPALMMERAERGYWRLSTQKIAAGTDYLYRIDDTLERPDPASRWQPQGVHGPSRLVDHGAFAWSDGPWRGLPREALVIYELHVGTFTPEGTFAAIIPRLAELRQMGITAIELMPVAQFPGERNWGYDGVCPFAVQHSYGGPRGLKELVDACHSHGLAVVLDVVYNHLGPEGNYLRDFGPYFTDRYRTPWGEAVNYDGPGSDEVRAYFIENALHWLRDYHLDALRLDAVHAIYDLSARPFLQELAERVARFSAEEGRTCHLIAESDRNDVRLIRPAKLGGYGLDAQWNDDFHHALHTLLTGENDGYYLDFGRGADLVKAYREGFVYGWRYSPFRKRRHGSSSADRPGSQLVVCAQNHDQVGNRLAGERLVCLTSFEAAKVAAAAVLLSPCIPLIFMGEEYAEEAPFQYFVSFDDADLVAAVRRGRQEEFAAFDWQREPPDPQSPETFRRSRLNWERRWSGHHQVMRGFYRLLLVLRRRIPALSRLDKERLEAAALETQKVVWLRRWQEESEVLCLFNFSTEETTLAWPAQRGLWLKRLDSAAKDWCGPGERLPETVTEATEISIPPRSCALYQRTR